MPGKREGGAEQTVKPPAPAPTASLAPNTPTARLKVNQGGTKSFKQDTRITKAVSRETARLSETPGDSPPADNYNELQETIRNLMEINIMSDSITRVERSGAREHRDSPTLEELYPFDENEEVPYDVDISERPVTHGMVGGEKHQILLDPGSHISIIHPDIAKRLPYNKLPLRPGRKRATQPDGSIVELNGMIRALVNLKGVRKYVWLHIMENASNPIILGSDALYIFDISNDNRSKTWHFNRSDELFQYEEGTSCPDKPIQVDALSTLSTAEARQLQRFIDEEIATLPTKLGKTTLENHHIELLPGTKPIKQRNYSLSPKKLECLIRETREMLANDVIEPSKSPWNTPAVLVPKEGSDFRPCFDFRKINAATIKDAYPIPRMHDILAKLRSAKYITTLDLKNAYFQVPLTRESREITAFSVPGLGSFQFKRLPYGVCNGTATFQRLMDKIITVDMSPNCFSYLDDVILVTDNFTEHLKWIKRIVTALTAAGLTINPKKCHFCVERVRYLGYLVDKDGLRPDPEKVRPVLDFPAAKNVKQLRRFLGMAGWYRRFLGSFAETTRPLAKLMRKDTPWKWGQEQEDAVTAIKTALTTAPALICPDFDLPFQIQCDASHYGLGAVLTQVIEVIDGQEHIVEFASRGLKGAEPNYSATELECLAVIWAIEKFRGYVEGASFKVISDHSALRWLHNLKDPTGRLARWAYRMQHYDFEVVYRKGALHHTPDALSRMYELNAVSASSDPCEEDKWYQKRLKAVQDNPAAWPDWKIDGSKLYRRKFDPIQEEMIEDLASWKRVVPAGQRREILRNNHDEPQAGHLGVQKTHDRIATRYYWPGMFRDTVIYVKSCQRCQQHKVSQAGAPGEMGQRVATRPWEIVAVDVMGPLPRSKSGYEYIVIYQDQFSKWVEIEAIRKANAKTIQRTFLDRVVHRWGAPRVLVSDNGTEFINAIIQRTCDELGVKHRPIAPYHAQANPVERVNRVVKTMITSFLGADQREWDKHLQEFQFACNSAVHASTQATPAFLTQGRELAPLKTLDPEKPTPTTTLADIVTWKDRMERLEAIRDYTAVCLDKANESQAHYYNRGRTRKSYAVGDWVWKRNTQLSSAAKNFSAKLAPKYVGPFLVVERTRSPLVYRLQNGEGKDVGTCHVKNLKLVINRNHGLTLSVDPLHTQT